MQNQEFNLSRMMARQLLLVSLALVLTLVAGSSEEIDDRNPREHSRFLGTLSNLQETCPEIFSDKSLNTWIQSTESQLDRLDALDFCGATILQHDPAWTSIMTHELDILYEALKKFIDARVELQKTTELRRLKPGSRMAQVEPTMKQLLDGPASKFLFEGKQGQRRFYWDVIEPILNIAKEKRDHELVYNEISQNFANLYYDEDFKPVFLNRADGMDTRTAINAACHRVIEGFSKTFLPIFDRLSVLAGNKRYFYNRTRYNGSLYKLRMTGLLCKYLAAAGQLVV